MTIEQMKQEEPRLQNIEDYALMMNEVAKTTEVYWWKVWAYCRSMMNPLIGWGASNRKLACAKDWDKFHKYLNSLTPNCK